MSETYQLTYEDRDVLEAVKGLLRKLAEPSVLRPDQLVTVAKLLHVASTAPRVCTSVRALVSVSIRTRKEDSRSMSCWQFSAFDGVLTVATGGSVYHPATGSDWFNVMDWSIQPGQRSELMGSWDEEWMVPELQTHPERKIIRDFSSGDWEISVEDEENDLLGDYTGEDNKVEPA